MFSQAWGQSSPAPATPPSPAKPAQGYGGPNVLLIRFGGGVRRQESIQPENTYCPFTLHELAAGGTLYTRMEIDQLEGLDTSHGEGTLNILTGKYGRYKDVGGKFLGARFEAAVPTLFEYLRKQFAVPGHRTLIINGEDRIDEEFYSFSNHHLFGANFRSNVLSLYRFKAYLLKRQLEEGRFEGEERTKRQEELEKMVHLDYRMKDPGQQSPEIESFWSRWRDFYGESGFVNPRGDRLLTELTIRALRQLRPQLLMVNYNDADYVHWGNPSHYTRGIAIMDEGIQRLASAVEADPFYRGNTVFVIVPDCGRDNVRGISVPFQHHFNTPSAHRIFAILYGAGITAGATVSRAVSQVDIAPTVGALMGLRTEFAEGRPLREAFA